LNALSVAIPATLALFFIRDRLQLASDNGIFLATYFFFAILGLPIWLKLAKRYGTSKTWQWGMLLAITAFIGAGILQAGQRDAYLLVCAFSGLALGADLCLPPVLLAQCIPANQHAASYFGIWTLLGN